jgi:hypothetical protein
VQTEGLIYLFAVEAAVAQQFSSKHEHRNFVPVARPRRRLKIHVDDIDGNASG